MLVGSESFLLQQAYLHARPLSARALSASSGAQSNLKPLMLVVYELYVQAMCTGAASASGGLEWPRCCVDTRLSF